jgi:hypothetical protein
MRVSASRTRRCSSGQKSLSAYNRFGTDSDLEVNGSGDWHSPTQKLRAIKKQETHSIKPPWKRSFSQLMLQVIGTKPVRFTEYLQGRRYCVTYQGRAHHYEVTQDTLDALRKVRERVYAAFDGAADAEFYTCPYCSSRDLKEVYGGRIYRCTVCDQLDELFMMARYKKSRTAKSAQSA